jgi:Tol biopolymer transport system component
MKNTLVSIVLLFFALAFINKSYSQEEFQVLKSPYLGQVPPGLIPEVFAPDIVSSNGWKTSGVFTPDLKEFYFIRSNEKSKKQEIISIQSIDNKWTESVFSPRVGTPLFSPNGKIMHLGKRYKERTDSGWSEVKELGAPFDVFPIMRLTASTKGTYFFDEFKKDFTGSIRYSRLVNGKHEEPKLLNKKINGGKSFHPFIAPDESYLIFDGKREGGYGNSDLYISYLQQDGSWGEPINLGDKINTKGWEAVASVTADGKYLLFNRNMTPENYDNVDIYWVDTQFIQKLRPKL